MPLFSHMQIVGFLMRWLNCDFIRNTDSNSFYIDNFGKEATPIDTVPCYFQRLDLRLLL